ATPLKGVGPELDLVQPAGMEGQEVEDDAAGMVGEPLVDMRAAVDVEIVEDQVDHLAGGHLGVQPVHEGDELLSAATGIDLPQDAAGVDLEGGEQAASAVADVLE